MVIGAFGDIVFEVSSLKVLTFDRYKRVVKAKYAAHEIINRPAVLELVGRQLEEISLKVKAIANLGVNPAELALTLRDICQKGEPNFLILDDTVIGENEFVITDVTENVLMWHGGTAFSNELDLNFKEYVASGD